MPVLQIKQLHTDVHRFDFIKKNINSENRNILSESTQKLKKYFARQKIPTIVQVYNTDFYRPCNFRPGNRAQNLNKALSISNIYFFSIRYPIVV